MAITLRGTPKAGATINGGNVTLTFDTGDDAPQPGDVVIVFGGFMVQADKTPGPLTDGYSELLTVQYDASTYDNHCAAYYKIMGASPDSEVVCKGNASTACGVGYVAFVLDGVDSDIIDATITHIEGNLDGASITTVTDGALVLSLIGSVANDTTVTAPSGYENIVSANGSDTYSFTVAGASKSIATAGAENPGSWDISGVATVINFTIAIRPYVVSYHSAVAVSNDFKQVEDAKVVDGGTIKPVLSAYVVVGGVFQKWWPPPGNGG